jgi:hypothetical protein
MCGALRAPTSNCVVLLAQGEGSAPRPPGQEGWIRHSSSLYTRHSASLYTHRKRPNNNNALHGDFDGRTEHGGRRTEEDNWYSKGLIDCIATILCGCVVVWLVVVAGILLEQQICSKHQTLRDFSAIRDGKDGNFVEPSLLPSSISQYSIVSVRRIELKCSM